MESGTQVKSYRCRRCGSTTGRTLSVFRPGPCSECGATDWEPLTVDPSCDFCGGADPVWAFPCERFPMTSTGLALVGSESTKKSAASWTACDTCKKLVETDRLTDLARRATASRLDLDPLDRRRRRAAETAVRVSHRNFMAHRTGPPRPL